MTVKDGSPGKDKIRFVVQVTCDETSFIFGKRRVFDETTKDRFDQGAAGGSQSRETEVQTRTVARSSSLGWSSVC